MVHKKNNSQDFPNSREYILNIYNEKKKKLIYYKNQ